MLILVDQDNVLADFEGGWTSAWQQTMPHAPLIAADQRTTFYIHDQYDPQLKPAITAIQRQPGFFRNLDPMPGAIEGIRALAAAGHDVRICTAPLSDYEHCVLEKYQWIDAHLGPDWVKRTILTKDKSLIAGDVLIDDKPTVTGSRVPTWTHVRYTQPYNIDQPGPRLTWADAGTVIAGLDRDLNNV